MLQITSYLFPTNQLVTVRVTQSRLTLCGPMDCSPPDSSVHGILQGKDTGVSPGKNPGVACHFLLQGMFPTQGLNPGLLLRQVDSLPSEPAEKPRNGQRNHSCWPHRLVLYKKTGFHFPCKLTGCPVPRLPGIHASRSGWEIHKVSWGPLISPVGMKAIEERLFHVQRTLGLITRAAPICDDAKQERRSTVTGIPRSSSNVANL